MSPLHLGDMCETETPQSIQELSKSIYIPRGINTEALDRTIKWDFTPTDIKVPASQLAYLTRSRLTGPGRSSEIMSPEATYSAGSTKTHSLMRTRSRSVPEQWGLSRI
jgi:hypothetical protein